jgi:magnesium transporter
MSLQARLTAFYLETQPADAARTLERFPAGQATAALETVPPRAAAAVLAGMESGRAAVVLLRCAEGPRRNIVEAMAIDVAARILRRVDAGSREAMLESLSRDDHRRLRRLLEYPDATAGMWMDPNVVSLPGDLEAGEAVRRLRDKPRPVRYYVYVTDREQRLTGVLTLRELLSSPRHDLLRDASHRAVQHVVDQDDRAAILQHPGWREFHALPVTDRAGVLVGVIRYETARRLEEESRTERTPGFLALGTSIGEAWIRVTATMLESLSPAGRLRAEGDQQPPVR